MAEDGGSKNCIKVRRESPTPTMDYQTHHPFTPHQMAASTSSRSSSKRSSSRKTHRSRKSSDRNRITNSTPRFSLLNTVKSAISRLIGTSFGPQPQHHITPIQEPSPNQNTTPLTKLTLTQLDLIQRQASKNTRRRPPHASTSIGITVSGTYPRLKRWSHRPEDLLTFLREQSFGSVRTPRQLRAMEQWKMFSMEWDANHGAPPSAAKMRRLIHIFSNIFFAGTLGSTGFQWIDNFNVRGNCTYRQKNWKLWQKIRMRPVRAPLDGMSNRTCLISTLLHECIHAFLGSYGCGSTCKDRVCQRIWPSLESHGSAFWRIASWIEALGSTQIFRDRIGCGSFRYIRERYIASGDLPEDHEIDGCHPEHAAVLHNFKAKAKAYTLHNSSPVQRRLIAKKFVRGEGIGPIAAFDQGMKDEPME